MAVFENQIKIVSNNARESTAPVWIDDLGAKEAMDYIYKCYKRDDRCCDLNDLKKDKQYD